jgi:asparagine synthase (glutamine-hydrolysing)
MFPPSDGRDWLSQILDFNYRTYLLDDLLIKMDRMSMAASLEVRSPFLSQRMIDLASGMPTGLKVRDGVTKWILKEAARRYLPDTIIDRPKMGFGVPLVHWWREPGPSAWLKELLLGEPAAGRGIWRREAIERMIVEHLSGETSHAKALWTLATIEQWYRLFIDPERITAPSL